MLPTSSSFSYIFFVPLASVAADAVIAAQIVTLLGADTEREAVPTTSIWYYIISRGRQLNSKSLRFGRFDVDLPQVRDEATVTPDTSICTRLEHWKHYSFKIAAIFSCRTHLLTYPF